MLRRRWVGNGEMQWQWTFVLFIGSCPGIGIGFINFFALRGMSCFSTILIKRQELQMCFQASKDVGDPAGIFMGEREYPDSFYPRPFSFSWGNMSVEIFILVKAIFSKSVAGLIIF